MITVFFLLSWTEYGIKNIKDSPSRFDEAKALLESMGGKVKDIYMTSGDYDMVMIAELPGDAVAKYALSLAQKGAVRTKTIRAWTESEYRELMGSL